MTDDYVSNDLYEAKGLYQTLGEVHDRILADLMDLRQRVASLEARDETLHDMLDNLEERFGRVLSDKTQTRSDLQDESHILHLGLAGDYHSLIMQWMQRVARKLIGTRGRSQLELDLGRQVAEFCDNLFRGAEPDVDSLLRSLGNVDPSVYELAVSMCDRACSLRRLISEVGVQHEWDFRSEISGILDDRRQEAWLTCDPTLPICMVVAPAYVVQGVVYGKQLVATSASSLTRQDKGLKRRNS